MAVALSGYALECEKKKQKQKNIRARRLHILVPFQQAYRKLIVTSPFKLIHHCLVQIQA